MDGIAADSLSLEKVHGVPMEWEEQGCSLYRGPVAERYPNSGLHRIS